MRDAVRAAALCAVALFAPLAYAQATLHIGFGAGTLCAEGCGGDPNLSLGAASHLDIFQNSGGAADITALNLILGVPNNSINLGLGIQGETTISPYPGGTSIAGSATLLSFAPGFNSGDIYSFAGLNGGPGSASDTFGNLASAEAAHGITTANFGIYVYAIHSQLGPRDLANITFTAPLPTGTFAFAYGEAERNVYDTPFTESGLVTSRAALVVPEPAAIFLFGTCLLLLVPAMRRSRSEPGG